MRETLRFVASLPGKAPRYWPFASKRRIASRSSSETRTDPPGVSAAARILSTGLGAAPVFSGGVEKVRMSLGPTRTAARPASTTSPAGSSDSVRGSSTVRLGPALPEASKGTALRVLAEAIHSVPPGATASARTSFRTSPAASAKAGSGEKAGFAPPNRR